MLGSWSPVSQGREVPGFARGRNQVSGAMPKTNIETNVFRCQFKEEEIIVPVGSLLQREKELLVVANLLQVISMSQTTENSERGTVAACFALAERLAELGTK